MGFAGPMGHCHAPEIRRKYRFAMGAGPGRLPAMTTQAKALTKQALALKPKERIELAERLLTSVDGVTSPEIEAAGMKEAERRIKNFEEGREQGIPSEVVFAKARALLDEIHKAPHHR